MNAQTNLVVLFSMALFFIGLFGVLVRKNVLIVLMSIELMLNSVSLALVAFSKQFSLVDGQMAVFFIITVAAAESAVGLGLVIALFRNLKTVNTESIEQLREPKTDLSLKMLWGKN